MYNEKIVSTLRVELSMLFMQRHVKNRFLQSLVGVYLVYVYVVNLVWKGHERTEFDLQGDTIF